MITAKKFKKAVEPLLLLRSEGTLHFAVPQSVLTTDTHVDLDSLSDAIVQEQHGSHRHRYFEFIGDGCFAEVENPFWRHHGAS